MHLKQLKKDLVMNTTVFTILSVSFIMNVVAVLWALSAVALILIVLIQKGKGGGLTGALGGGAVSGILGSQTKGPLTWITICLVGMFLLLAVVMARFYRPGTDFGAPTVKAPVTMPERPAAPPPTSASNDVAIEGDANGPAEANSPGAE